MKEIIYNKLVRDRIPDIMIANKETPKIRVLDDEEYLSNLKLKLKEEVNEFLESEELEELADILEVIYAVAVVKGSSQEEIKNVREEKRKKRGGFDLKIFLESKSISCEE